MNPFRKLKLKSQLRNCDYVLAGTVIKQQYYDSSKSTVINRLIDEYMENPCFDTALALIEYNEMMVFYFTESCDGGLYVRKTSQDHARSETSDQVTDDAALLDADIPTLEQLEEERRRDALELDEDGQDRSDDPLFDTKRIRREEKHRQILQESEEWMEQLLASREPRTKKYPHSKREYEQQFLFDNEQVEGTKTEIDTALEAEEPVLSSANSLDEEQDTIQFTPVIEANEEAAAAWESDLPAKEEAWESDLPAMEEISPKPEPIVPDSMVQPELEVTATAQTAQAKWETAATVDAKPEPKAELAPQHPIRPKRAYPNVIATLKIDIHTMVKQLEDYRHQLSYQPFNEKQLIAWIKSLEEAIEEFSEVVDLLEDS